MLNLRGPLIAVHECNTVVVERVPTPVVILGVAFPTFDGSTI